MGTEGEITLRITVFSGDAPDAGGRMLDDRKLKPGEFYQYNEVLKVLGSAAQGYVKVEKINGDAPFYAYGVINDNFNSDGSFVFPVTESSLVGASGQTLPVIIETGNFQSELTVTNFSASEKTVKFSFVADAVETGRRHRRIQPDAEGRAADHPAQPCQLDAPGGEGGGHRSGRTSLRGSPVRHAGRGRPERHRDRSEDGVPGPERWAIQPLLQRGALWLGFG